MDFVYQHFSDFSNAYSGVQDVNRFYSIHGPVLPLCSKQEQSDPKAECSLGPIIQTRGIGRGNFNGLLIRAEKKYSDSWQILGSYAFTTATGHIFTPGYNNDDPLANYGPLNSDFRHVLAISGTLRLPWHLYSGAFLTYVSRPPASVLLGGTDLNGDGTTGDLFPGTRVNQLNRGIGKQEFRNLVDVYNATYAGQRDARGSFLPLVTLPLRYEFSDPLFTQDLRLSRDVPFTKTVRLTLMGESYNLWNVANLSGRGNNVFAPGFGQPKSRVTQVFGSGGPRAFQLAAELRF
jgi:hypothetical protein